MGNTLAFDPGYGNIKLYGQQGGLALPSAVAVAGAEGIGRMAGLRSVRAPLRIRCEGGDFYVGEGAHDWGRPLESLDFDRLVGAPELKALFLGALSRYGPPAEPIDLVVGLPIATLMGEDAERIQDAVRDFLGGEHSWRADDRECAVRVQRVRLTSQPVGAMFDYLLDESGQMAPAGRAAFQAELGVLSLGMNTVELLVVRDRSPVQRFTAGERLGVRRLLELAGQGRLYSLAELDQRLRCGELDVSGVLPIWQSEVFGYLERSWGNAFLRFQTIIAVGGGAKLLRAVLLKRFRGRAHIPEDPIIATARGLFKFSLMQRQRQG